MKKVGEFWLPDVDLQLWRRFGKTRRKTIERYTHGGPKLEDLKEVLSHLPKGGVAIDGGANVGAYARMLATHFEFVYAFEPAVDTFEALERNIKDWELQNRVIARNEALSDSANSVALALKLGGRSVSRTISGPGDLPATTLDSLQLSNIDLIKLDLEGHEFQALVGAKNTLRRCQPAVLFEDKQSKRDFKDTSKDPHRYLKTLGYKEAGRFGRGQFDWLYVCD